MFHEEKIFKSTIPHHHDPDKLSNNGHGSFLNSLDSITTNETYDHELLK